VDMAVLQKKISTFKTEKGRLTKVSDELLMEILVAWEEWTGSKNAFYKALGVSHTKMAKVIGKAKKLKREGHFPIEEFKEIKVGGGGSVSGLAPCSGVEVTWDGGKLIRFAAVDQLIDFLKKVA
jgi:hypothetical protein